MANSYKTAALAAEDRQSLNLLLEALDASPSTARRDTNGLWVLQGSRGYCSTWGDNATWQLVVAPPSEISGRKWTAHKARLAFAELTQDGDAEGCFRLHRLPTSAEAVTIRDVLGLRKKIELSAEELARRQMQIRTLQQHKEPVQ